VRQVSQWVVTQPLQAWRALALPKVLPGRVSQPEPRPQAPERAQKLRGAAKRQVPLLLAVVPPALLRARMRRAQQVWAKSR
jgi:hypothetical protein